MEAFFRLLEERMGTVTRKKSWRKEARSALAGLRIRTGFTIALWKNYGTWDFDDLNDNDLSDFLKFASSLPIPTRVDLSEPRENIVSFPGITRQF